MTVSSFSNNNSSSVPPQPEISKKHLEKAAEQDVSFQRSEPVDQDRSGTEQQPTQAQEGKTLALKLWQWTGVKDKTLWDYLQLLIVPLLLLTVTEGMNQYQKNADELRNIQEQKANLQRMEQEKKAAESKAKQDTLNSYISAMTDLMKNGLGEAGQSERLEPIATSRTILTLRDLDGPRNMIVLGFLKESNLIRRDPALMKDLEKSYQESLEEYRKCQDGKKKVCQPPALLPSLDLGGTDLSKVDFKEVDLNTLNLKKANLRDADLTKAVLIDTNLTGANLTGAHLPSEELLKGVRYCNTKMPNGTTKNDDCSFIPKAGSQYKVVTGNMSGTSSDGWTMTAYRDPVIQDENTSVEVPHGTTVTLTGEYLLGKKQTWVKIKDEGTIGGWVSTKYLVPVDAANK